MIKTFKIKTLDDKPVYFPNSSKFISFEFNMDSQETEMLVEVEDKNIPYSKKLCDTFEV